jgi:predicted Rossmann fold nucleotide-binding protein DprA/Smf involved in DNA uptake
MNKAAGVLSQLAALLRKHGWQVTPPPAERRPGARFCETCGATSGGAAVHHALDLAAAGVVTAPDLAKAAGVTVETARNELSELARDGRLVRIGHGRYRAC